MWNIPRLHEGISNLPSFILPFLPYPHLLYSLLLSFVIGYYCWLKRHPSLFEISFPKGKIAVREDNFWNDSCTSDCLLWDRLNYALSCHRLNITISRTFLSPVLFKIGADRLKEFKVTSYFTPFFLLVSFLSLTSCSFLPPVIYLEIAT